MDGYCIINDGGGGQTSHPYSRWISHVTMEVRVVGMNGTGGRPFALRRNLIQQASSMSHPSCHYHRTPETTSMYLTLSWPALVANNYVYEHDTDDIPKYSQYSAL